MQTPNPVPPAALLLALCPVLSAGLSRELPERPAPPIGGEDGAGDATGALAARAYLSWITHTNADGLPSDKVLCVLADGDDVWAGTDAGLARLRDGRWTSFSTEDGLAFPVVSSLALSERTGDLWIGTFGGLSRWSAGRFDTFDQLSSGLVNDVIYAVAAVEDHVWVATSAGLSRFDVKTERWELFTHENTVMHEPWCYGLTTAPGLLYVAVWGGGVVEHDLVKGSWKAYRDPDQEMEIDLFRDDGLIHDVTSSISYSDGTLWVGTYFGMSRYDGRSWRGYLEHDTGLPSNFVNVVRGDGAGVWVGTDNGLAHLDGGRWTIYRRGDSGQGGRVRIVEEDGRSCEVETAGAIAHDFVLGLEPLADCVWVATAAGLSVGSRVEPAGGDGAGAGEGKGEGKRKAGAR